MMLSDYTASNNVRNNFGRNRQQRPMSMSVWIKLLYCRAVCHCYLFNPIGDAFVWKHSVTMHFIMVKTVSDTFKNAVWIFSSTVSQYCGQPLPTATVLSISSPGQILPKNPFVPEFARTLLGKLTALSCPVAGGRGLAAQRPSPWTTSRSRPSGLKLRPLGPRLPPR